jgi:hypothetical protein
MKKKKIKKSKAEKLKFEKYQRILALKPTQFAVGHMEVEFKSLRFMKMKKAKLRAYIEKHPIPVIISPWKELCIIDHHHLALALWHARVKKVLIEVREDFSNRNLSYPKFWYLMKKKHFAYLNDQFGDGPRSPYYLPLDVRGLADDPYRSLAWMIRKEGKFDYPDNTYVEFIWANFFRTKRLLDRNGREGFADAIKKGLRLLKRSDRPALPGQVKKVDTKLIEGKKKRSKYVTEEHSIGHLSTIALEEKVVQ